MVDLRPACGNVSGALQAAGGIASAFGAAGTTLRDAVSAQVNLRTVIDAPRVVCDFGFAGTKIPEAVGVILATVPGPNPCQVTEANLRLMLQDACSGTEPALRGQSA